MNFAKKNTEERSLTLEDNFRNYLKYGGLPEIHNLHFKEDSISNIWMLSITQLFLKMSMKEAILGILLFKKRLSTLFLIMLEILFLQKLFTTTSKAKVEI
uniref:hypothetical protein n=1 Tax=Succinivibrio sp. TaxID=2053619 RepID=UPI00402AD08A